MKKLTTYILLILLLIPINIYAYSNKIIIGGETIGIEIHSNGVYIVGFYNVNGKNIAEKAGFQKGDIIQEVNNNKITNINSLNKALETEKKYNFKVLRNETIKEITLKPEKENNIIKTGLYVKDQITGIGTLSYIDPETKIFGALGHEIIESSSLERFNLKEGNIYKAEVSSIKKSTNGLTGEKNANINKNENYGNIKENEINGIYGNYVDETNTKDIKPVGTKEEIQKGSALIRTVINNDTVEEFKINILTINESDPTKNILFEITDEKLLNQTGGIVQGMSGSPIIQNGKIIGVVNYVIIEEANKGYGIFITSMLEEGDKINN